MLERFPHLDQQLCSFSVCTLESLCSFCIITIEAVSFNLSSLWTLITAFISQPGFSELIPANRRAFSVFWESLWKLPALLRQVFSGSPYTAFICCSRFSVHCQPTYSGTTPPLCGKGNLRLWDFMEFIQGSTQKEIDIMCLVTGTSAVSSVEPTISVTKKLCGLRRNVPVCGYLKPR